jgi:hypothetical protein
VFFLLCCALSAHDKHPVSRSAMGECTAGHAWQQVNLTMVRFEQFFLVLHMVKSDLV